MSAAAIFVFLTLVVVQVVETAWATAAGAETPEVTPLSFAVMGGTLAINVLVVTYESRAGRRLKSEVLVADALHTRSDVYTSLAVIAALIGMTLRLSDPGSASRRSSWRCSSGTPGSRSPVKRPACWPTTWCWTPTKSGAWSPRCRKSWAATRFARAAPPDYAFLDLHVWFPPTMTLDEAHRLSHLVKDRLLAAFPALADVIIHIEPPPRD